MPRFVIALIALTAAVACSAGGESVARGTGGSISGGGASGTAGTDPGGNGGNGGSSYGGSTGTGAGGYSAYGGAQNWEGGVVWKSVSGNLVGLDSGGVGVLSIKPGTDTLIAAADKAGIWSSADGGVTWTHLGEPDAGSEKTEGRPTMILYDPTTPTTFWITALWGKIFKTTDDGVTFKSLGTVNHNDTVSVDFTDPARKTILAGGHEQTQTVQKSTDGGATWTNIGSTLPADSDHSSAVYVVDANTYLVGCAGYAGKAWGVFRTTDGGATWTKAGTGGATRAPLVAGDGSIYFSMLWEKGLTKSADKGATWTEMVGWGNLASITPIELPDKRLAAFAFDQTVKVSTDARTWTAVTDKWNQTPNSIVYSTGLKAFFMAHGGSAAGKLPPDAIVKMAWDYTTK